MSGMRYREIDSLRGTAVVMMVIFHTVFILDFFGVWATELAVGFWRLFALSTASIFITVAGVSLSISSARAAGALDRWGVAWKNVRRGTGIFLIGMGITLVTWLSVPDWFVRFGVLHCIGLSIALSPPFLRLGRANLPLGAGIILLPFFMSSIPFIHQVPGPISLVLLGMYPADFQTLDYVPLIPWFGVFLVGMGLGSLLYPGGNRHFPAGNGGSPTPGPLTFLGRHSLPIYLVHVPVLLLLLSLLVPGLGARLISLIPG
jgi:uncharacterized membrane protein